VRNLELRRNHWGVSDCASGSRLLDRASMIGSPKKTTERGHKVIHTSQSDWLAVINSSTYCQHIFSSSTGHALMACVKKYPRYFSPLLPKVGNHTHFKPQIATDVLALSITSAHPLLLLHPLLLIHVTGAKRPSVCGLKVFQIHKYQARERRIYSDRTH